MTAFRLVDVEDLDPGLELVSFVPYHEEEVHPFANSLIEIFDMPNPSQGNFGHNSSSLLLVGGCDFRPTQT